MYFNNNMAYNCARIAKEKNIKGYSKLSKDELINLLEANDVKPELEETKEEDEK